MKLEMLLIQDFEVRKSVSADRRVSLVSIRKSTPWEKFNRYFL